MIRFVCLWLGGSNFLCCQLACAICGRAFQKIIREWCVCVCVLTVSFHTPNRSSTSGGRGLFCPEVADRTRHMCIEERFVSMHCKDVAEIARLPDEASGEKMRGHERAGDTWGKGEWSMGG